MTDQPRRMEHGLLTIRSARQGDGHLVTLNGEMDGWNARTLDDELIRLGNDGGVEIVLDLSQLEFIDSTGLAVIVRAHGRATNDSHVLRVVPPQGQVARAFELTGLDKALSFVDLIGKAEAVEAGGPRE